MDWIKKGGQHMLDVSSGTRPGSRGWAVGKCLNVEDTKLVVVRNRTQRTGEA